MTESVTESVTEAEWLGCADPLPMLRWLNERDASPRKLRLFSCACVRSVWELMPADVAREAVLAAERFADGQTNEADRRAALEALRATYPPRMTPDAPVPAPYVAGLVAYYCAWSNSVTPRAGVHLNAHGAESVAYWTRVGVVLHQTGLWRPPPSHPLSLAEAAYQGRLLRDIFGNPFRSDGFDPRWRTADAVGLASAIYEDRAFDRMPILADALIDAGCDSEEILSHCRSEGPHVRGCWVVDLVLGKT